MSWASVATAGLNIGASLLGGSKGSDSSLEAARIAAAAQDRALAENRRQFNLVNDQSAPQRQAGYQGLSDIAQGFGQADPTGGKASPSGSISQGYFAHQFDANDLKTNLAPNYDFMLQQGQGAATNALNLTGGLGGNFAQGLNQFTQNYAGNAYQSAFNNYTANQQNIFNRLSTIAGYGTTANSTVAGSANALTPGMSNAIIGAGQAQAAGVIGANANKQGGVQNAASWFNASGAGNSIANLINNPILRYGSDNVFSPNGSTGNVPSEITNWDS